MSAIKISDPRIEAVREQYSLDPADFWELPHAKGKWCVKHSALESVAARAGIVFDMPMVVEGNGGDGSVALVALGRLGDRSEWSVGEASPKNNKNAYPWAMAEKRAKDRVILKLAGIHELVYSEDELTEPEPPKQLVKVSREADKDMRKEVDACATVDALKALWRSKLFQAEYVKLHETYQKGILELFDERTKFLSANPAVVPPNFDALEKPFPGDTRP